MNATKRFVDYLSQNKAGMPLGAYSICSAQENVIRSGMKLAREEGSFVLVESTSNQVDQNGGYTGMKPADFVAYVHALAAQVGFPRENVLLGGDHLGPNVWQAEAAESAMQKAHVLVREYVKAGYQKIHLDASMFLADDAGDRHKPLADQVVAERAAALCKTCEDTWRAERPNSAAPVYIIGTEVPIPGGAQEAEEHVRATEPADVDTTIQITRDAFLKLGLEDAWSRVVAAVVQPGVEFGDDQVFDYRPEQAKALSKKIESYDGLVYEAHSTDYQTEQGLAALVRDHFCILKVGPWLTYAFREALFALEQIERELTAVGLVTEPSNLRSTLETVMLEKPKYWQKYYPGNSQQQLYKRAFSFSDRCRYYWPEPQLVAAKGRLSENLKKSKLPLSLLSQYLPDEYRAVREGRISNSPEQILEHRIESVLRMYSRACGLSR